MFERFTDEARALVLEAQAQRRALGDRTVGTEHLLLALLADPGPAGDALRQTGIDADQILGQPAAEDDNATGGGARADSDDELLLELGIDIEVIRRSLDETLGPGALDRVRAERSAAGERAATAGRAGSGRHGGFDSHAKRVLEGSLRESLRLKTKHIGPEHIGLGILREGAADRLLATDGLDVARLRGSWEQIARQTHNRSHPGLLHRLRH